MTSCRQLSAVSSQQEESRTLDSHFINSIHWRTAITPMQSAISISRGSAASDRSWSFILFSLRSSASVSDVHPDIAVRELTASAKAAFCAPTLKLQPMATRCEACHRLERLVGLD
jgi:hypothetical protein